MRTYDLDIPAYIRAGNLGLVDNISKKADGGLLSPKIFGITEREKEQKCGYINLGTYVMRPGILDMFRRVDATMYKCCTDYKMQFIIYEGTLMRLDGKQQPLEGAVVGSGPRWLYDNWDLIDKKKYLTRTGVYANVELKRVMSKLTRDQIFVHHQWVGPTFLRQEMQEDTLTTDQINVLLEDILKYSIIVNNFKEGAIALQNKVMDLFDYLDERFLGPNGAARKKTMSRTIDFSSRTVMLTNIYRHDEIGKSKINCTACGMAVHLLSGMFLDTTIKFAIDFIKQLYDNGCFDSDVTPDMLIVYDKEYLRDQIKKLEDPHHKITAFPAVCADGTFRNLTIDIDVWDKRTHRYVTEQKELSWLEFFYMVLETYADIYNKRSVKVTRYPTDSTLSTQYLKPVPLTLYPTYLRKCKVFGVEYEDYPYVNDFVKENYNQRLFETAIRIPAGTAVAYNGDHDLNKVTYSQHIAEDCKLNQVNCWKALKPISLAKLGA